ncbi:hypothetical protein U1Q18_002794 [Sarracenia purpurea var. burkii]
MPPRSATRKKSAPVSARARKPAPKSKQSDVEMSPVDQNSPELENEDQDLVTAEDIGSQQEGVSDVVKDEEDEQPATAEEEIKQELGVLDANSTEVKGLPIVVEDNDVSSTSLEARVKQEVVEGVQEGRNVEDATGDHISVNIDSFIQGDVVADEDGESMEGAQIDVGDEENDNAYVADLTEKCDDAVEEEGAEAEQTEDMHVGNAGTQTDVASVAEQNLCEEGTDATQAQTDDAKVLEDNDNVLVIKESNDGEGGDQGVGNYKEDAGDREEDNRVDKEDERLSSVIDSLITDGKKEKDLEIFIGSLDKGVVEDDLIEVFGKFGEIRAARVVRNPTTNKSRGFAFIQYAMVEQAKNALTALKDGIQVRGKRAKISASQDNDTLYVGNICKLWTKERVLETLKSYGVENIEDIHLPDDPQKKGKIKGFALLEFSTHSDALAALQRLRKPDAVFGRDRTAKVAFAQSPMHPNQEVLSQVKTVYVEGITDAWNEEKLKEICKQYGDVEEVKLSRSLGTKRKDYGFITFTSRESALACVEGINGAHIGEGEVKAIKAHIAKPHFKGRLQKQGTRGGFKVEKETVPSTKEESERENEDVPTKTKVQTKSKRAKKRAKMVSEEKGKGKALSVSGIGGGGKPNKHQTATKDKRVQALSKLETPNRKRKNLHSEAEGRGKIGPEHGHNEKPSKKPKGGNKRGRKSDNFRKPKRDHIRKESNNGADFTRYRNPRAHGYAASAISYQSPAYTTISGSKRPYADMAPHAGYIEPVARKQGRSNSGYLEPLAGTQYQPHVGYRQSAAGTQSQPQTRYLEPALGTHSQPHAGYLVPTVGSQGRSHAGYLESAIPKYTHDPYGPPLRRAGKQDFHGSGQSAYGSGSSLPPRSYAPNYTNYAVYEDGSSVGGHYQSSGAHLARRAYY